MLSWSLFSAGMVNSALKVRRLQRPQNEYSNADQIRSSCWETPDHLMHTRLDMKYLIPSQTNNDICTRIRPVYTLMLLLGSPGLGKRYWLWQHHMPFSQSESCKWDCCWSCNSIDAVLHLYRKVPEIVYRGCTIHEKENHANSISSEVYIRSCLIMTRRGIKENHDLVIKLLSTPHISEQRINVIIKAARLNLFRLNRKIIY